MKFAIVVALLGLAACSSARNVEKELLLRLESLLATKADYSELIVCADNPDDCKASCPKPSQSAKHRGPPPFCVCTADGSQCGVPCPPPCPEDERRGGSRPPCIPKCDADQTDDCFSVDLPAPPEDEDRHPCDDDDDDKNVEKELLLRLESLLATKADYSELIICADNPDDCKASCPKPSQSAKHRGPPPFCVCTADGSQCGVPCPPPCPEDERRGGSRPPCIPKCDADQTDDCFSVDLPAPPEDEDRHPCDDDDDDKSLLTTKADYSVLITCADNPDDCKAKCGPPSQSAKHRGPPPHCVCTADESQCGVPCPPPCPEDERRGGNRPPCIPKCDADQTDDCFSVDIPPPPEDEDRHPCDDDDDDKVMTFSTRMDCARNPFLCQAKCGSRQDGPPCVCTSDGAECGPLCPPPGCDGPDDCIPPCNPPEKSDGCYDGPMPPPAKGNKCPGEKKAETTFRAVVNCARNPFLCESKCGSRQDGPPCVCTSDGAECGPLCPPPGCDGPDDCIVPCNPPEKSDGCYDGPMPPPAKGNKCPGEKKAETTFRTMVNCARNPFLCESKCGSRQGGPPCVCSSDGSECGPLCPPPECDGPDDCIPPCNPPEKTDACYDGPMPSPPSRVDCPTPPSSKANNRLAKVLIDFLNGQ